MDKPFKYHKKVLEHNYTFGKRNVKTEMSMHNDNNYELYHKDQQK